MSRQVTVGPSDVEMGRGTDVHSALFGDARSAASDRGLDEIQEEMRA